MARDYSLTEDDVIQKVKIVSGGEIASLDTTGTLTQKYQARIIGDHQEYELISCKDTDNLLPHVANGLVLLDGMGPNAIPTSGLIFAYKNSLRKTETDRRQNNFKSGFNTRPQTRRQFASSCLSIIGL